MNLSELAPSKWFSNPETSSFWLRIYPCLFVPHDQFPQAVSAMFGRPEEHGLSMRPASQVAVGCGRVSGLKIPYSTFDMSSAASGQLQLHVHLDQKELRDTP